MQTNKLGLWIALLLLFTITTQAQDTVTVPDITGLNVPQAAAELNRAGLRLGNQEPLEWTQVAPFPAGTISAQSVGAGESVTYGTSVDITVLSEANVTLIYDDNDLTMINQAGVNISIGNLSFNSSDGTRSFLANRWRQDLPAGDCTQIWSIRRNQPKTVEGCDSIFWLTTINTNEHFWTQTAGVDTFTVVQSGIARATCDAAPPNSQENPATCQFFVVTDAESGDFTGFVYFAYTTNAFTVINISDDSWMPLTNTTLYNFNPQITNPGASLQIGDMNLFQNDEAIVADVTRLAPNQCLMLTVEGANVQAPPQECDVVAQRALVSSVIFWSAPFELDTSLSIERSQCPAATPDRVTVCIMPR